MSLSLRLGQGGAKEIEEHDFPTWDVRDFKDVFRRVVEYGVEELAESTAYIEGSLP